MELEFLRAAWKTVYDLFYAAQVASDEEQILLTASTQLWNLLPKQEQDRLRAVEFDKPEEDTGSHEL